MPKRALRLLLGFVMFAGITLALWPVGQTVYANWSQQQLRAQWRQQQAAKQLKPGRPSSSKQSKKPAAASRAAAPSKTSRPIWPATRIVVPEANLDVVVLDGWDESTLKKAPGHLPSTALPGANGNCVIAGHRNVYGSPFYKVDALQPGAVIELRTAQANYQYRVVEVFAAADADTTALRPPEDPEAPPMLTLVTCTIPRTSNRILVSASLELETPL